MHEQMPCQAVAATCSVKMAKPVERTQPESGTGTSLSSSDFSKLNPNKL